MDLYTELFWTSNTVAAYVDEEAPLWAMEDIQEKTNHKLHELFSFYEEQETLDQMHGIPID